MQYSETLTQRNNTSTFQISFVLIFILITVAASPITVVLRDLQTTDKMMLHRAWASAASLAAVIITRGRIVVLLNFRFGRKIYLSAE